MSESTDPQSIPDPVPLWLEKDDGTYQATHFEPLPVEELNRELPQYELGTMFSSDLTGALYRGRQEKLDRDICLKLLPPMTGPDAEAYRKAFRHEAQTMATLSHPNIIKVHDFGETDSGLPYFVMEYVEGSILRRMLRHDQIGLEHVFGWIPPICEALQYAHLQGVVHCDIRPTNILITNDGVVKVANFGLSRIEGQRPEFTASMSSGVTATTLDYASPEMRQPGASIDYRTDIYSLGVVLYEMLTGKIPRTNFKPASEIANVDPRFDDIVERALNPDIEARWQTALDIGSAVFEIHQNPAKPERKHPKFNFG